MEGAAVLGVQTSGAGRSQRAANPRCMRAVQTGLAAEAASPAAKGAGPAALHAVTTSAAAIAYSGAVAAFRARRSARLAPKRVEKAASAVIGRPA